MATASLAQGKIGLSPPGVGTTVTAELPCAS
jgi:hypothetical protein